MKPGHSRLARRLVISVLTPVLLGTGTCVQTTQEAVIDGFFNSVTPLLVDCLAARLAATDGSPDPADGGG